jgi:integrase
MLRHQRGHIYLQHGSWHVRYYLTEIVAGVPVRKQRSHKLCMKDDRHHSAACKLVRQLCESFMRGVNDRVPGQSGRAQDMPVVSFWERYLLYCEEIIPLTGKSRKKASTVRGYRQIWRQHLSLHFGKLTLQEYEPRMGTQFLQTLTGTQGKNTLKHIKALGSSLFKRAVIEQRIKTNPWHDVEMPDDAVDSAGTKHYTLVEAEDIISALVDHVDCQLVMALSCFLGLRPGEIAALRWEDFDMESVHIRRSVVRGIVGTPKTPESMATLPLIDLVRAPLMLWREKCGDPEDGWVFPSRNGTPVDLHNMITRTIVPILEEKGLVWKSLYSGRRGACTMTIEATNGNYAVAQALLRHKSMTTTLSVYKKQITPDAFRAGMKLLQGSGR